ncbi:MAG: TldD/PmbA family protein [Nitrospirae bacterium]|nr:TldD/PmbA family protein [Nitrospirota bacterium]
MKSERAFAAEVISEALGAGADQAEVFIRSSKSLSVEVKKQEIDSLKTARIFGYGLRVIKNGRPGFAYSTDRNDLRSVIRNSVDAAGSADPDPFADLPEAVPPACVDVYDPEIDRITEPDAISLTMDIEKACLDRDKRIEKVRRASSVFSSARETIFNSKGVEVVYRSTFCTAQSTAVAETGDDAQSGYDYCGSRLLRNVDFRQVGACAADNALRLLGARRISDGRTSVILDRSVAVDFLEILAGSVSADSVQKNRSLLSGKIGRRIISAKISISDNGLLPGLPGSSPVDDEGVPAQEKILIDRGILKMYLHNTYTAAKDSAASTGNAVRGGFSAVPSVGPTNLYIEASSDASACSIPDMYGLAGSALHIFDAMGVHTANPVSGDFSIGVSGILIEGGRASYPVKEAVISGNILDLFLKAEAVGDDLRFFGNIGSPSILIRDMDISA